MEVKEEEAAEEGPALLYCRLVLLVGKPRWLCSPVFLPAVGGAPGCLLVPKALAHGVLEVLDLVCELRPLVDPELGGPPE